LLSFGEKGGKSGDNSIEDKGVLRLYAFENDRQRGGLQVE
jgi:hypothetical protein